MVQNKILHVWQCNVVCTQMILNYKKVNKLWNYHRIWESPRSHIRKVTWLKWKIKNNMFHVLILLICNDSKCIVKIIWANI